MPVIDRYALLGHPLAHSLSPLLHGLISERCGLDSEYVLEDCPPAELDRRWPELLYLYRGFNVTLPYKQDAFRKVSDKGKEALLATAVNTVLPLAQPAILPAQAEASERKGMNIERQSIGHNTDYLALRSLLPSVKGKTVLLLGYGGVAAALANVVLEEGCGRLLVGGRNPEKARHFAAQIQKRYPHAVVQDFSYEALELELERPGFACDCLLQGTSAGMWPRCSELPLPEALLRKLFSCAAPFVFESIYNPAATRLLLLARSAGLRTQSGLMMLFRQGLAARKIWRPEYDFTAAEQAEAEICAALGQTLRRRYPQKLLLTGFMGAGKSRILGELARLLGAAETGKVLPEDETQPAETTKIKEHESVLRGPASEAAFEFLDLDRLIESAEGRSIPDIFAGQGEAAFRLIEAERFAAVLNAPRHGSLVLATGGGTLLQPNALRLLREAGALVIFLDVSLSTALRRLGGGRGRPLLQDAETDSFARKTAELYNLRRPLYQALADLSVDADAEPGLVARAILRALGW